MPILYIDERPTIDAVNGHWVLGFASGGEKMQVMLTPHHLRFLRRKVEIADAVNIVANRDNIVAFNKRKGRRANG
jgi:hypothetical protein